jgi:hypothetical protein
MTKRVLFILLCIFGLSSLAGAQRFSLGGGVTLFSPNGTPLEFGLSAQFSAVNLLSLGVLNVDARASVDIDFGTGGALGFAGFGRVSLPVLDFYLGPTVNVSFTRGLGVGAILGLRSPVSAPIGVFGEVEFMFVPASLRIRAGVAIPIF